MEPGVGKVLPPEILEIILRFSDLDSIKNFRLVCQIWNKVALPILRKNSKICLSPRVKKKFIINFNNTFENLEVENLPFDSIKLACEDDFFKWEPSELDTFFEQWGHVIKYLELYKSMIKTPVGKDDNENSYELSPAVQRNLSTLILDCTRSTIIDVSVDHLMALKTIKLTSRAALKMGTDSNVLTPTEIELNNPLYYYRNGTRCRPTVPLDHFIDFSLAKKVTIRENSFMDRPGVSLDMSTKITVDELTLRHVDIVSEDTNKWIVKGLLSLSKIPWVDSNEMKFTSLDFQDADLDVSKLPQTIEYLRFSNSNEHIESSRHDEHYLDVKQSDPESVLPNLKFLSTNIEWPFPEGFRNCDKLTELDLSGCCVPEDEYILYDCKADGTIENGVEFELLPCNLKKLQIDPRSVLYSLVDDRPLEVDTLIVNGWLLPSSLKKLPRKLKPQNLVLMMLMNKTPNMDQWEELLKDINQNQNLMVIYLGPIGLYHIRRFPTYVDTSTVDYQGSRSSPPKKYWFKFENNAGKAISESEFDLISKLSRGNLPLLCKCKM